MGVDGNGYGIPVLDEFGRAVDRTVVLAELRDPAADVEWPLKTVGMFCDGCGSDTGPVDVLTDDARVAVHALRERLVRSHGWVVAPGRDLCRRCASREALCLG